MQQRSINSDEVARTETQSLIAASYVEGTVVFNSRGDSLGSIHDLMIDKRSGRIAYAVMSFGGFLGVGQSYHALQWDGFEYDSHQGGYVLNAEAERMLNDPSGDAKWSPDFVNRIDDYFGTPRHGTG